MKKLIASLSFLLVSVISFPAFAADTPILYPPQQGLSIKAESILERRPLPPTDISLFSQVAYPAATPMVPAAGPPPTEVQVEKMLKNYLKNTFPRDRKAQATGLALFDNPELIAKIPNPSLRAGLVGLLGTAGEPAIDFILNEKTTAGLPKISAVGFDTNPWDPTDNGVAKSIVDETTEQMAFVFNPKYQSEYPFQFTRVMAHEVLHSDPQVAGLEEATALAIDSSIYLEQLAQQPKLAQADTELTRRGNTNALTRLNSGTGKNLGLFESNNNQQILPGSPLSFKNWAEQFPNLAGQTETPGNLLLKQFLTNIAEPGRVVPENPNFSQDTLNFIDQNSNNLSSIELVKAARALKLDVKK